MSTRPRTALLITFLVILIAAACGGDSDESSSEDTPEPDATEEPTTGDGTDTEGPDSGASTIDESPVTALFETAADTADPSAGPLLPAGSAAAWWYDAGDVYAVVFTGVDVDVVGKTCPGNSIQLADGSFDHVSNTALADGDCEGITVDPAAEARVCDGTIVYKTVIPTDAEGVLFASFGGGTNPSAGQGAVTADLASTPELDTTADSYAFPASMGGPVTC